MEKLRLGAQKLGIELQPAQLEQFESYYRELIDWNRRVNLTAITDYEEVQLKHFLDSLTVARALAEPVDKDIRLIDVGTGAGIPGIPLKILRPEIRLVLLDATARKARFLEHIIAQLGLDGVEITVGRAEEVAHQPDYRERFGVVLSRAVAGLSALVELTLPFCAVGGRFIAQKKGDIEDEVNQASRAIDRLGGKLVGVENIDLPEFADQRRLVIIDKVSPTPEKYPRRPGIPVKRPLV